MTAYEKLKFAEQKNNSILCVGLDVDVEKIPPHLEKNIDGMLRFNREIIDATKDIVSSYKLNFAFYEQYGRRGIELLEKTIKSIPKEIHIIADAKRGDIGNTSRAYAKAIFEEFGFDSITVNPYMGKDSVLPFLRFDEKMVFLLCLTSNTGSEDFEKLKVDDKFIYEIVLEKSLEWGKENNIGYVVGATHPEELKELRGISQNRYFLIPGIGKQGGKVGETMKANGGGNAIINSSRGIIYASKNINFAEKSRLVCLELREQLNKYRN